MTTRREFLKRSTLLSLVPFVPRFLGDEVAATLGRRSGDGETILVVLQLDGGNDGLNTVIPRRDELYRQLRPAIAIDLSKGVKLGEEIVLHPSLRALAKRCDDGQVAVVQGVSYPNPNRSHFESMRIWQTALPAAMASESLGWLGLAIDPLAAESRDPPRNVFVGRTQAPLALNGRRSVTIALRRLEDLQLRASELAVAKDDASSRAPADGDLRAYVERVASDSYRTAARFATTSGAATSSTTESDLDRQLETIARLIAAEAGARIYYTVQSGYDTHAAQPTTHANLLADLATAIDRFFTRLEQSGQAQRVALLAFSEFGRRVAENAGSGTDHGTAGPVFMIGPRVRGGLHGVTPRLDDLVDGDLKPTADFRSVYATAIADWLRLPLHERLAGHATMPLFR
jgi:uncharacterized protein (DUF1501 family)